MPGSHAKLVVFLSNDTFPESTAPEEQYDQSLDFVVERRSRGDRTIIGCGIQDELLPAMEIDLEEVELLLAADEDVSQVEAALAEDAQ